MVATLIVLLIIKYLDMESAADPHSADLPAILLKI